MMQHVKISLKNVVDIGNEMLLQKGGCIEVIKNFLAGYIETAITLVTVWLVRGVVTYIMAKKEKHKL